MKTKILITYLIGVTLAASGAFAIGSAISNKKAESVDATTQTIYLHASSGWTNDSAWFAVYQFQDASTSSTSNGIYFVNKPGYTDIKIHVWGGSAATNWPGETINNSNKVGTIDGYDVYYYYNSTYVNGTFSFIISGGSDRDANRTGDVTGNTNKCVWYGDNKASNSGKHSDITYLITDSWTKMNQVSYSGSDKSYYSCSVQSSGYKLIFTRMNKNNTSLLNWSNVWNQSYDLPGIQSGMNCYQIDSMSGDKHPGSWHVFNPSATNAEILVGTFERTPWSSAGGFVMVSDGENKISTIVPLTGGDEFKLYKDYYLDGGFEESSKYVLKSGMESLATQSSAGQNIVMKSTVPERAYKIEWCYADEGYGIWISYATDTEASLTLYVMQKDTNGQCNSKFSNAKDRYLDMDPADQSAFQSGEAHVRYEAWAAAKGQKPYEEGAVGTARELFVEYNKNTNTIAIIVIISLVSVTAIGGFFFIRKRREN